MKKLAVTILLLLFPCLVLADGGSLSFAPPASDYSVVFLGNLFGVVDGVLSGTGSQIMGSMFAVFNAAVLALGGIIIMYTLIVATMNTAHEGQMLGQKWSSIWIPIRSTIGLALLIPKASGYCMMQIFVMWVVVQGVGAADKVWDAALSYLNRGGVIIQAQQINPASALTETGTTGIGSVATGVINILSGQVCMLGLQTQLENVRQGYLNDQSKKTGKCYNAEEGSSMQKFCNTVVPDFLSTVNTVAFQSNNPPKDGGWTITMPYFNDSNSSYYYLNGICGSIHWNDISSQIGATSTQNSNNTNVGQGGTTTATLTPAELTATKMSRAIAIQQMYMDLTSVARTMVSNDPAMQASTNNSTIKPYYPGIANQQFGVPYTPNGTVCKTNNVKTNEEGAPDAGKCIIWGPVPGSTAGTLFNGTELLNAMNDYNGIMMPTINLIRMIANKESGEKTTDFINKASTQGWIMAGAYFFNLVQIQGTGMPGETGSITNAGQVDSNTGLDTSQFDPTLMMSPFVKGEEGNSTTCDDTNPYYTLCVWFGQDSAKVQDLQNLITVTSPPKPPKYSNDMKVVDDKSSSTTYGFINNGLMMQTPGQPGAQNLTFANTINFSVNTSLYRLHRQNFSCGEVKPFYKICLGQILGNIFFNIILVTTYNLFLDLFGQIIQSVVMAFLMIPLQGMAEIFQQGLTIISTPGVNPVVALANMGNHYINFAGNLWMVLLNMAVSSSLIFWFGIFVFPLLMLGMPLVIAWVGVMVTVGFVTAYYIPILPYMIFTFGALGWLISVIEAMVSAPIVALGVTHPEGHEAFGKGEPAIMILLNVFLRPALMIIGYIAAIALSYVGIWVLNAGYDQAISFIQQANKNSGTLHGGFWSTGGVNAPSGTGGYSDWAGIYAFFFSILTYTTMYLTIIQKAFTLISYLPDKVLRWIGGTPESLGQETAQWGEEVKGKQERGAEKTQQEGAGPIQKQLGGYGMKAVGKAKGAMGKLGGGGEVTAEGGKNMSTGPDSKPDSGTGSKQEPGSKDDGGKKPPPLSK